MSTVISATGQTYYRLPGRAKRLFALFVNERQRLFLGDDHLLIATSTYYYERYKRFYLADIQALTIQKSAAGAVLNLALGTIAGLWAALALAGYMNQWDAAAQIVCITIAGIFLGGLLINTAFGPTCQTHVLTAVHEEPLHCLGRLYTALRVVEYLREVIENVQGTVGDLSGPAESAAASVERAAYRRQTSAMLRKDSGLLHLALFSFLIIDAAFCVAGLYFHPRFAVPPFLVVSFVAVCLALAAAVRQRDTDVPRTIRAAVWAALVSNVIVAFMYFYAAVYNEAGSFGIATEAQRVFSTMTTGFALLGNGLGAIANIATGSLGLYYIRVWRRAVALQANQQRSAQGSNWV